MADQAEKNTTRNFLNATNHAEGTLQLPKRGRWNKDQDLDFLAKYARSIDLKVQLKSTELAHSVPSVFQRPIQFYQAMEEQTEGQHKNPLHDAVQDEWRGLMAVIALDQWAELKVQADMFTVPHVDPKASSSVGSLAAGDLHLRTMLRNQLPLRIVPGEGATPEQTAQRVSDWEQWWMIRCNGVMLGATSPWTLLYTAAKYTAPPQIPWQRDGKLIDPIKHYAPIGQGKWPELAILYAWLTSILAEQQSWGFPDHLPKQRTRIVAALEKWRQELAIYEDKSLNVELEPALFPDAPLQGILQKAIVKDYEPSDLWMDAPKGSGQVLVFSTRLGPTARVYRSVFAGRVDIASLEAEGNGFITKDGITVKKRYIVAEKLFFPGSLVELKLWSDALMVGQGNMSIPLTPAYFRYFDHGDVEELLSVHQIGKVRTARLTVPVKERTALMVEHAYPEEAVYEFELMNPTFALWPERYDETWPEGFAAYAVPEHDDLRVRPLFRDGSMPGEDQVARMDRDQKTVRIWQCHTPAVGFSLQWGTGPTTAADCGLVLRQDLRPPLALADETWRVGVDFGTSSTTVMVAKGGNPPTELKFSSQTIFLTADTNGLWSEITNNLYPKDEITPPFRTLLYRAAATVFGHQRMPYTLRFAASAYADLTVKPVENVKWGSYQGQGDGNPLMAYLHALVRYIVWEARRNGIANLEFHWSYPLSLPIGPYNIMWNFWNGVVGRYASTHMRITVSKGMSESEAACRSIDAALQVRASALTITVDIGGGSTDIAFWSNGGLLSQLSFKLAGNDILDRSFLTNPALLKFLSVCYEVDPENDSNKTIVPVILGMPEIYLNNAMIEAKDRINGVFRGRDPHLHPIPRKILGTLESEAPWKQFRSMIYLFFTGLSYYLGVHARSIKVKQKEIDVYFGGRGSAFLTWLHANPESLRAPLKKAFLLGLGQAPVENEASTGRTVTFLGLPIQERHDFPALKTEVAKGLLMMHGFEMPDPTQARKVGCMAGEVGWTKRDAKVQWQDELSPEDLALLTPPDNSGLESTTIGHFKAEMLGQDTEHYIEAFSLDDKNLKGLQLRARDMENLIRHPANGQEGVSQPIFAFELKALMQQYAKKVAETP